MAKKRQIYTREFKIEAVRLVTEESYSIREAAESLGISDNSLRTWRKQLEHEADNAFPGKGKVSSRDEQMRRLQEENRRLRMERDILKKVAPRKAWEEGIRSFGRMKLLIGTLCGREPVRQSLTGSRKRVLRGVWVTGTAKRRQRVQKPCY